MRILIYTLLLLSPTPFFAQKMLESSEWCGKKHSVPQPAFFNLSDGRSDSIDILHTRIELNLMNAPQIMAGCALTLSAKVNGITEIRLDLQGLTVDSVRSANQSLLPFVQAGPAVIVQFAQAINTGDQTTITVHYRGIPPTDASGWGGFYHTGGYSFNLGVGFAADPHSFGRAWFPCFDNFVERSSFEFDITSPLDKPSYCNGTLFFESTTANSIRRVWKLDEHIPSYLACFAIGPYTSFLREYQGQNGLIPLEIAAAPADTNRVRNTFQNLQKAIEGFEDWFGPYQWEKIGYSLVPFNSGAMEHATNIAIGRVYVDGTLNYETLWAHELGHMWWGDLATCSTAEDMWLNEGWASYCEHLFTEKVYGQTAFRNAVRANHLPVLQNAHINEGGYRAVSGLPHNLTYGAHVYNKGATVAHNLRGYLGDSLFRVGCREALAGTRFEDWSSAGFRDKLEAATGQDLHDFFEDWVFAGGYPDYTIDSTKVILSPVDGPTLVRLFVKQKLRGAPHFHQNVPLEITFLMSNGQRLFRTGMVSGENAVLEFQFPAWGPLPLNFFVNTNQKIMIARAEGEKILLGTGNSNFTDARFNLTVNALGADSVLFRVEHHYAAPDQAGANPDGYALSNRYWSVLAATKQFPAGFDAQAVLIYDGRGQGDQLDAELFAATGPSEDSVVLLYRPGPGHPWQEWPTYTKVTLGSTTDRFGQLRPTGIAAGEYTIGKGQTMLAAPEAHPLGRVRVSPNPSKGRTRVQADEPFEQLALIASDGQTEKTWNFAPATETSIDLEGLAPGTYWLWIQGKKGSALSRVIKP